MNISSYWDAINDLDFLDFNLKFYPEIIFDAIQTFGLVLKKLKTIFSVSFGKIESSLQKYHILMPNMVINSCKSLL